MKKLSFLFGVLIVATMVLSACVNVVVNTAPVVVMTAAAQPQMVVPMPVIKTEELTLGQFFLKYGWGLVPDFQAVAFNQETKGLRVIYHEKMVILTNDSGRKAFLGQADGNSMKFVEYQLNSQEFYNQIAGKDMVIMSTNAEHGSLALVAIPAAMMPKMADMASWDKTEMSFSVWSYPKYPLVVENSATGEILVMAEAFGYESVTREKMNILPGQSGSGYIHFEMTADSGLAMYLNSK